MIFKRFLIGLSCIGFISTIYFLYNFIGGELEAIRYANNCTNIKVGMTIVEARKVMGDLPWNRNFKKSVIWIGNDFETNKPVFYLDYPLRFAGSGAIQVYFNPDSQIVTKVVCSYD